MANPRLFVSHSSEDNDLTREICALLEPDEATGRRGYDVLVDFTELEPGTPWPRQLHEWMARCHAALVLLTKRAVESPWVLKEATILSWRLSLEQGFKLFVLQAPDVTEGDLRDAKFEPLSLGEIQRLNSWQPADIADQVRATIGRPPGHNTPFDRLVGRLRDLLAAVGDHTLQEIAEKLAVEPPRWRPDRGVRSQYVEEIARQIICENLGSFEGVHELIDALSFTPSPDNVKQVYWIVAPCWVDAQAAGPLPAVIGQDPPGAAGMNGVMVGDFTANMYVQRAFPLSRLYRVIPTAGGASGDTVGHVTQEVCDQIRSREGREDSNEVIIEELKRRRPRTFVVVAPPHPDNRALAELREVFPKVAFILWTGSELERDESLENVVWLEPPVDTEREELESENCREAEGILRDLGAAV